MPPNSRTAIYVTISLIVLFLQQVIGVSLMTNNVMIIFLALAVISFFNVLLKPKILLKRGV